MAGFGSAIPPQHVRTVFRDRQGSQLLPCLPTHSFATPSPSPPPATPSPSPPSTCRQATDHDSKALLWVSDGAVVGAILCHGGVSIQHRIPGDTCVVEPHLACDAHARQGQSAAPSHTQGRASHAWKQRPQSSPPIEWDNCFKFHNTIIIAVMFASSSPNLCTGVNTLSKLYTTTTTTTTTTTNNNNNNN